MPSTCSVLGCKNRGKSSSTDETQNTQAEGNEVKFHRFPSESKWHQREQWLKAVKNKLDESWTEENIHNARICSEHFISGMSKDPLSADYKPSIFPNQPEITQEHLMQKVERHERFLDRQQRRNIAPPSADAVVPMGVDQHIDEEEPFIDETDAEKIERLETENCLLKSEVSLLRSENLKLHDELEETKSLLASTQNDSLQRMMENMQLRQSIEDKKNRPFSYKGVRKSADEHHFYTGITVPIFCWLVTQLAPLVKNISKKITTHDHLLLVLMKLRMGYTNRDLAYRFNLPFSTVSTIFRLWIVALAKFLGENLIIWPEKPALRMNLPKCFRKHYKKLVCIIDCTEIFIQRPLNLNARAQTWSNYKKHHTIKYFVGCTPAGAVSFVSDGWGGRVADKEITLKSGFLELLEIGDQVLADRGFTVKPELAVKGAILETPSFTKGKSQLPASEVDFDRKTSNVRIHIERVIGRLKTYHILETRILISQVDLLDEIMVSIAGLVNLNPNIV